MVRGVPKLPFGLGGTKNPPGRGPAGIWPAAIKAASVGQVAVPCWIAREAASPKCFGTAPQNTGEPYTLDTSSPPFLTEPLPRSRKRLLIAGKTLIFRMP